MEKVKRQLAASKGSGLPAGAASEAHAADTAMAAPALMYDAILMDFVMPRMDGPTATKAIRAMGCDIPIFGVTGNGMKEDIDHFIAHGATGVLVSTTPLQPHYLSINDIPARCSQISNVLQ